MDAKQLAERLNKDNPYLNATPEEAQDIAIRVSGSIDEYVKFLDREDPHPTENPVISEKFTQPMGMV